MKDKKKKKTKLKMPTCVLKDTGDFKLKVGDGIFKQMEAANKVSYSTVFTDEELIKTFEELSRTHIASYGFAYDPYLSRLPYEKYGLKENIKEELEKGSVSQILVDGKSYEIIDGEITRVLTVKETQKLKDGEK
jgi:hypothetical protein